VLDPVIEKLHLAQMPEFAAGNRGGDATLRDWVESKLLKSLEIEAGKGGSQLIYVTASAHDSALAANIANSVAETYIEQQARRTSGPANDRAARYTEELADLKAKVVSAQEALTRFRTSTGAVDLDARIDVDMGLLDSLEHRLLDVRNAQRSNQAKAGASQDVSSAVLASDSVRQLRTEEASLNARMAKLRTEFGPNHPQVVELQSQIEANAASLAGAIANYSRAATSEMAVSGNEATSLEKAVGAQRAKVLQQQKYRDQGAKYRLEVEAAQTVYKRALDGYDQIMFASTGNNSNIGLMTRARIPVKAASPNPIKNMALGTFAGIFLGFAGMFAFELARRRVRCRDDMERTFGVRVLTEFTSIKSLPVAA
jgi:uncharacterized protein involved in exopolysaccharide biosynthesis